MANKAITSRDIDFAKWYTDVVKAAHLADYSNVKGCTVFEPNGYAIWEKMQSVLDGMFKASGHKNVAMPMLIPENLMKKEGELINDLRKCDNPFNCPHGRPTTIFYSNYDLEKLFKRSGFDKIV